MRRSRAMAFGVGLGSLAWLGSCSDGTGPECADGSPSPCTQSAEGVILSDPAPGEAPSLRMQRAPRGLALSFAPQTTPGEADVAYISLPSNSYSGAAIAHITSSSFDGTVTAPMIEGGLDPVPVSAAAGDSVEIEILSSDGVTLARTGSRVPVTRRPRVVRTVPPRGKTDVAVNAIIVVIFSEPIDESTLSSSSIRLLRGGNPVAGTARLLEGVTAAVTFQPAQPLTDNTAYTLVVTQGVHDLDGDALEEEAEVVFTSGSQSAPPVTRLTVLPNITGLSIGSRLQLVVTAVGGFDTLQVPIPIAGVPILWATENPAVATVSTSGLVTAVAPGETRIRVQALHDLGVAAFARIMVGSQTVASLELSPPIDTTPTTGKIEVTAVTRDDAGNVLPFRPVSWNTSNAAVATVEETSGGKAWVTGVSSGSALIIATSEGKADTAMVEVAAPGAYQMMSAGSDMTCGLRAGAWAFCWGENAFGQVGDATASSLPLPRAVSRGLQFVRISAGGGNTCAVTADRQAYCWGINGLGSLGIGSAVGPEQCELAGSCSRTPIAVLGGQSFTAIDVSLYGGDFQFACGVTSSDAAYCWGSNSGGLLGVGTTAGPEMCAPAGTPIPCSTTPVEIGGGRRYTAITLGGQHACALTAAGAAFCWGTNVVGQLGDGTETRRLTPVAVGGGLSFVSLSAGGDHSCGLTSDGSAYCWGSSASGALGHGAFTGPDFCQDPDPFERPYPCSTSPARVTGGLTFATISAGGSHTCALTPSGVAYCWGSNWGGQLGNATTNDSASPVAVAGGLTFASLSAGRSHTCGVTADGVAYCWGTNDRYALGNDDTLPGSSVPVRVEGQP
jgi:alpha-tubulin suppressor-like RCC1 family protein